MTGDRPGSPANVAVAVATGAAAGLGGILLLLWLVSWVVSAPAYQVIIACAATLAVLATGLAVVWITNRDRDDGLPFGTRSAKAHLRSLQQATPAETTLDTDLRQRRMLLRPHGLTEAGAARLAGAYRAAVARRRLLRTPPRHHASTPGLVTPAPPRPAAPPQRTEDGEPGHPAGGPSPAAARKPVETVELPPAEDDPLFSDDTQWRTFTAIGREVTP